MKLPCYPTFMLTPYPMESICCGQIRERVWHCSAMAASPRQADFTGPTRSLSPSFIASQVL